MPLPYPGGILSLGGSLIHGQSGWQKTADLAKATIDLRWKWAMVRDAAKAAGIGERTAHRRLADPTFRVLVERTRRWMLDQAVGRIAAAGSEAADTLRGLLKSDDENIKLRAASTLVKSACQMDVAERDRMQRSMTADEAWTFAEHLQDAVLDNVRDDGTLAKIVARLDELCVA